jgi:hypothetical protein
MGFQWIVPYNSTQADTNNPVFFLGMWGLVALVFTYLAYARITRSFRSVFVSDKDSLKGYTQTMLADFVLHFFVGFAWLIFLYGYAWGGYIGTILYNYVPNGTPVGTYGISLTQDIYCLGVTSIGTFYLMFQFFYRYYLYTSVYRPATKDNVEADNKLKDKPVFKYDNFSDNTIEDALMQGKGISFVEGEDKITSEYNKSFYVSKLGRTAYILRFYFLALAVGAWVILPGAWAYSVNRDLVSGGAWLVLVECILLSTIIVFTYFSATFSGIEAYWFPCVNILTYSDYYNKEHATKGFLVGQRMPMAFIAAYMFYDYSSEIMIFGDQMKPLANFYVCLLLPLLMAGAAKDLSTFFPYHIAMKTYYFLLWYCMQSFRTPAQDSAVIDKVIIDYNAGCTGAEYRFMNTYNTTFVVTAAVGFGIAALYSLIAGLFYHAEITRKIVFIKNSVGEAIDAAVVPNVNT